MKRILVGNLETEVPSDVADGEVVEVVRQGGPRDGDLMGYGRVIRKGDEFTFDLRQSLEDFGEDKTDA